MLKQQFVLSTAVVKSYEACVTIFEIVLLGEVSRKVVADHCWIDCVCVRRAYLAFMLGR